MKRSMMVIALVVLPIYAMLFIAATISNFDTWEYGCKQPLKRYEYVFPAKQVGCWLGQEADHE